MALRAHRLRQLCCPSTWLLNGGLLLSVLLALSQAQVPTAIRPDGTLGTTVTQSGNAYDIMGGTRPGNGPNLFHSFDRFSVGTNDIARFSGPSGIENILSRVTGGQQSVIDGRLQSTIAGANLYLLNPSGVLFGPNATLDVSGSFHVSTADYLRFVDGATFSAHLGQESTLTVAPPAAFGFLGSTPAGISLLGSKLEVPEGKTLSLLGGDIKVAGGSLSAPSGRMNIASVASPGEVIPNTPDQPPGLGVQTFERLGEVVLSQGGLISVSGNSGGTVVIRGGRLMVDAVQVSADTMGDPKGAPARIDIQVAGKVALINGALITADVSGAGTAGRSSIIVVAKDVTVVGGAQLSSSNFGAGQGGTVTVNATDSVTVSGERSDGASVSTIGAVTRGTGDAGDVAVAAKNVILTDGGTISSGTFGPGRGGTVTVRAADSVTLSGTSSNGSDVSAIQAVTLGRGDAGDVVVEAKDVAITGGGQINSITFRAGRGGTVTVRTTNSVILSGTSADITFPSGIGAVTLGIGDAGQVVVEAKDIRIADGAQISGATFSAGQGGTVTVRATNSVLLSGTNRDLTAQSGIVAGSRGTGNAGQLIVEAQDVTVTGGAVISSSTLGAGKGGTIVVRATDAVTLSGSSGDGNLVTVSGIGAGTLRTGAGGQVVIEAKNVTITERARITSSTLGSGQGGDIKVQAQQIDLSKGGTIMASSASQGNAGNIVIRAGKIFQSRNGAVTTEAEQADGGNIQLTAGSRVELRDSQITATVKGGAGKGGNITIDPQSVVSQRSQIRADAFGGPGGNVRLVAEVFLADPESRVSASSTLGIAGTVDIQAPVTNLSGVVSPLTPDFARATELLRDRCAARLREGTVSSFVVRGRDGVPANPDGVLPSRLSSGSAGAASLTSAPAVARRGGLRPDDQRPRQARRHPAPKGSSPAQQPDCTAQ